MEEIKVTQIKSTIGSKPEHRKTMQALGLRKIGSTRTHKRSPQIDGMVRKVSFLVKVEKVS
ncbi:MAG: 50S ribosomal protein L30 [Spirochaetota bacterium]